MSSFLQSTPQVLLGFITLCFNSLWAGLYRYANTTASKSISIVPLRSVDCPYKYLLSIYGPHHFKKIIAFLNPSFEEETPELYLLVLDILDAVHFGAILVDDVADCSTLRKGQPAAHRIYGSAETVNRAYLVIFNALMKCQQQKPSLIPFILDCVTEIHQGQDDSLVWRRDGFELPDDIETALAMYRGCASLKTGALFRLVGQLTTGSHKMDDLMSEYGWYCQLQNDCKNVFSSDVISAKGALAEDLINGEYSYPILVGLYSSQATKRAIEDAFDRENLRKAKSTAAVNDAVSALQSKSVRSVCLQELKEVRMRNQQLAALWGREEIMSI